MRYEVQCNGRVVFDGEGFEVVRERARAFSSGDGARGQVFYVDLITDAGKRIPHGAYVNGRKA